MGQDKQINKGNGIKGEDKERIDTEWWIEDDTEKIV